MKPAVIIIVSEVGSGETLELNVRDRAHAEEIVREVLPPRVGDGDQPDGDYPAWTYFIPNPLPQPRSPKPSTPSPTMETVLQSLRVLLVLTALTGIAYPLVVIGIARVAFRDQATGSVGPQGSRLLAQKTESPKYFWPRPSAGDYATVASGASNKGPTSADLAKAIAERREKFGKDAPDELLTASGSGLDPHLSSAAAKFQAPRVAAERKISVEKANALIDQLTEGPQLGVFGEPRVNVLALNQALNALK